MGTELAPSAASAAQMPDADFGRQIISCDSPKAALAVIQKLGLNAAEVASILYAASDVPPGLLGECLGNHAPFWQTLALEYPMHWDCFADLDIVSAIRKYTYAFRLPGESAPIERILEGFSKGFFAAHQSKMPDTAIDGEAPDAGAGEPSAFGWYVRQPLSHGKPCCVSCGKQENTDLASCWGCKIIHFCPGCRKGSGSMGHAIRGRLGYGRACVAAHAAAGNCDRDNNVTVKFFDFSSGCERSEKVTPGMPKP